MAKKMGRPEAGYKTIQARVEAESMAVLRKIAGISGQSVPELMHEWLLPVAREELAKRLRAETQELGRAKTKLKESV